MRKIEHRIVSAISNHDSVTLSPRDRVESSGGVVSVYLHGHKIVTIRERRGKPPLLTIDSCGWRTHTTKSRINAVLNAFTNHGVYQRKHEWFVSDANHNSVEFKDGMELSM